MAKKNTVKSTMTIVVDLEASEGTPGSFFDKVCKELRRNKYVEDAIWDSDTTDQVTNPGHGLVGVKTVSIKVS